MPGTLTSRQEETRSAKIAALLAGCNPNTVRNLLEKSGALQTLRMGGMLDAPAPSDPEDAVVDGKVDVVAIRRRIIDAMTKQMENGDANAARVLNQALEDMEYESKADAFHIWIVPFDEKDRVFIHRTDKDEAELMIRNKDGSTEPYRCK